ncbi:CBS domain-containing protein [Pseudomonas entomophila]|uniref:transporter associated domain-containing protein n=1 Tax=Pseudomonas entomophila TaxID=312306 RepID=UPI0015E2D039|nr:transporter associated domain-containing protein [Pseudomonas entomophila]MBA1193243.1 CBS domain-containing protein [Pseudomonas entomophila]
MDAPTLDPLIALLVLALLWSMLFGAVEAAQRQITMALPDAHPDMPRLSMRALILCTGVGRLLVLGSALLIGQRQAPVHGFWLAGLGATLVLLVLTDYLPRRLAHRHPRAVLSLGDSLLHAPLLIVQPLACLLDGCARLLLRPFQRGPVAHPAQVEQHDALEEPPRSAPTRSDLLEGVRALQRITVNDILIPRNDVDGINLDDPIETITAQLRGTRHTRLPVYHADINQVQAVLNRKTLEHLLKADSLTVEQLKAACHEPYFIPEGTPLQQQLLNFHKQQRRLGLVVDEYGDVLGLVTLEDILEEIVGEFEDEQGLDNPHVHPQADGRYVIDGVASLREINRSLGWHLPCDGGPKTLNGLVTEALESIPASAVCLKVGRYRLEILETEDNRASKVLVWTLNR